MTEEGRSILLGTLGLSVAALVALVLTITRAAPSTQPKLRHGVFRIGAIAVVLHAAHSMEELSTGFYVRFPALLGLQTWPVSFFVAFNLFCMAAWTLSLVGLQAYPRLSVFPIWFLAIGSVLNGIGHVLLAAVERGYFPGLWTA